MDVNSFYRITKLAVALLTVWRFRHSTFHSFQVEEPDGEANVNQEIQLQCEMKLYATMQKQSQTMFGHRLRR